MYVSVCLCVFLYVCVVCRVCMGEIELVLYEKKKI